MKRAYIERLLAVGALLPALLFTSCIEDRFEGGVPSGDQALVTFSLNVPGASKPSTRAMTEDQENAITAINVIAFKDGVYSYTASGSQIEANGASNKKKFTATLRKGNYDLVLVANATQILSGVSLTGKSKADAMALLEAACPASGKWAETGNIQQIPMWGNVGLKDVGTDLIPEIPLLRMVARVNVTLSESNSKFSMTSVHLYNYNANGMLAPAQADWNSTIVTAPNLPATPGLTEGPVDFDVTATNTSINDIYMFEAAAGSKTTLSTNPCIVVGGTYDGQAAFYRIDLATDPDTYLATKRNHSYNIDITAVKISGYPTADDAFRAGPENITVSIIEWNDGGMGNVVFDGQYYLGVSEGDHLVSSNAQEILVTLQTDYPAGWTIAPDGTIDWVSCTPTQGAMGQSVVTFDIEEWTNAPADPTVTRTATFTVSAGRLRYKITIVQRNPNDRELHVYDMDNLLVASSKAATDAGKTYNMEFFAMPGVDLGSRYFTLQWWPTNSTMMAVHLDNGTILPFPYADFSQDYAMSLSPFSGDTYEFKRVFPIDPGAVNTPVTYMEDKTKIYITDGSPVEYTPVYVNLRYSTYGAVFPANAPTEVMLDGQGTIFPIKVNTPSYKVFISVTEGTGSDFIPGYTGTEYEITSQAGQGNIADIASWAKSVTIFTMSQTGKTGKGTVIIKCYDQGGGELTSLQATQQVTFTSPPELRGKSNSYMIKATETPAGSGNYTGGSIMIPTAQVVDAMATSLLANDWISDADINKLAATVLWHSFSGASSTNCAVKEAQFIKRTDLTDSYVMVTPGNKEGSAGVALFVDANGNGALDGTEQVKWSWHIWYSTYYPYDAVGVPNTTWMDRNLGAMKNAADITSYGLFYQWGRKDPVGKARADNNTDASLYPTTGMPATPGSTFWKSTGSGNNLLNSIQRPMAFIVSSTSNLFWWLSDPNGNDPMLWKGGTGTYAVGGKSVFDPCPEGWKVPTISNPAKQDGYLLNDETGDWIRDGSTGAYSNGTYGGTYPAAGFMQGTGTAAQYNNITANTPCMYATSEIMPDNYFNQYVRILYIEKGNPTLITNGTSYGQAGQGFQVRCVKIP